MSRSLLQDPFDHHVWATLRLIDACDSLDAEQLAMTAPGTYGSILDTVRHIVGADAAYLFVLTGGRFHEIEEADMSLSELRAVAEACGPAWSELLRGELDPDADVVRHRDDGSTSTAPLGIRIGQAIQHGTDHRSQICTALTTLGVEPPEIDVWAFADSQGRLSETQPAA
jgi:uncharacterized damage-inducible protein DinB